MMVVRIVSSNPKIIVATPITIHVHLIPITIIVFYIHIYYALEFISYGYRGKPLTLTRTVEVPRRSAQVVSPFLSFLFLNPK